MWRRPAPFLLGSRRTGAGEPRARRLVSGPDFAQCDRAHIGASALVLLSTGARFALYRAWSFTMLTALVLICSVAVTPNVRDCTRASATAVMRLPAKFGNPAACFLYG